MPGIAKQTASSAAIRIKPCMSIRMASSYYNSGGWVDSRLTYLTIDESGVQIHDYDELNTINTNMTSELTIVIPAKNEAKLIPRLLTSLTNQDYSKMSSTRVLVADANSTDGTPEIVMSFRRPTECERDSRRHAFGWTKPGSGGCRYSLMCLFLDADMELADRSLLRRCMERAQSKQLALRDYEYHLQRWKLDRQGVLCGANDLFQYLSYLHRPFATGMFMFFDRKKFW